MVRTAVTCPKQELLAVPNAHFTTLIFEIDSRQVEFIRGSPQIPVSFDEYRRAKFHWVQTSVIVGINNRTSCNPP